MVGPRQGAVEREVLLEHDGSQGRGGHRHRVALGVVGVADRHAEGVAHGDHGPQIDVGRRRRVLGRAVQDGDAVARAAGDLEHGQRRAHLGQRRHAGRDDQRQAQRGDPAQVGHVDELAAGHLEALQTERRQKIDAVGVEGRRQELDAALPAVRRDLALFVGRQLQGAQHLELVAGRAGGLLLVDGPGRAGRGQQVGVKALELDRVGARRGGRFDELQGHGERAVVVDAGLGDDKDVCRPAHRGSQRAGTPTATAPSGTSATTAAPTPTTAPAPMRTPCITAAPVPT